MLEGRLVRVRGNVQGVGFRPHVARLAETRGLAGWVRNDADGVTIAIAGGDSDARRFTEEMVATLPPLARVDEVLVVGAVEVEGEGFAILESGAAGAEPNAEVCPDAAVCRACADEVSSPYERRYRYPFASCTHCGPRFSIQTAIPYDRPSTTMASFAMCEACAREYGDHADRRYHAQPIACHACGPKAWLERADGRPFSFERWSSLDMVDAAAGLVKEGAIVAVKGLGGFHLVCDATQDDAVARLRARKKRDAKPFALMVRDLEIARRIVELDAVAERALLGPAAPIVLAPRVEGSNVAPSVAPGLTSLGVMVPMTPLHLLLMKRLDRPVVCTSGNVTDEPTCTDDADARARLGSIAEWFLLHDRPIAQRVDDSVVRPMAGAARVLRRARGLAPSPLRAPPGFADAPPILALGGLLKGTFCLLERGRAVLSPHYGDLDDLRALQSFERGLAMMRSLFHHAPRVVACDLHPEYPTTSLASDLAETEQARVSAVQHHHAHVAACMFEHGHPLDGGAVIGVALDGLGMGEGGALFGGEVFIADYARAERVATFKPVPLLGGDAAAREPFRNLYAHLVAEMRWPDVALDYAEVEAIRRLAEKPLPTLAALSGTSPRASSAGRLFDAVAAAVGLCFDRVDFEGQAAMQLEALVDRRALDEARASEPYPIAVPKLARSDLHYFEPLGMWRAILGDLFEKTRPDLVAARFHLAVAEAVRRLVSHAARRAGRSLPVALSGGVFQNRVLSEATIELLERDGMEVWTHASVPANDGGISLGQAAVAAARAMMA